jgi:hypothetical protein
MWLPADLDRREMQDQRTVAAELVVPVQGARPIGGREMELLGIDLQADRGVLDPTVRLGRRAPERSQSRGFHRIAGSSRLGARHSRNSASGADRVPSSTSMKARRTSAVRLRRARLISSSSAGRLAKSRWIASATTARTVRRSRSSRAASTTARAGEQTW